MKKIFTIVAALWISVAAWAQIPTNGLKFYYNFDENLNDNSGNGHQLVTFNSNSLIQTSTINKNNGGKSLALKDFGNGDYIRINGTSNFNYKTGFSVSFWVYNSTSTQNGTILSKSKINSGEGYNIYLSNGYLNFGIQQTVMSNSISSGYNTKSINTINTNTWIHCVATFDGNSMKLFINGQLQNQLNFVSYVITNTKELTLGTDDGYNIYNGNIDDLMFYDKSITSTEVSNIYNIQRLRYQNEQSNPKTYTVSLVEKTLTLPQKSQNGQVITYKIVNSSSNSTSISNNILSFSNPGQIKLSVTNEGDNIFLPLSTNYTVNITSSNYLKNCNLSKQSNLLSDKNSKLVIDKSGNTFFSFGYSIYKMDLTKKISLFAGSETTSGYVDGAGSIARFEKIMTISIDINDNIYILDGAKKIRKITPTGLVSTITKTLSLHSFSKFDLAQDSKDNTYVINYRSVLKISNTGTISTFVGNNSISGQDDETGTNATFININSITIDNNDNLFIGDKDKIRKISPEATVSTISGYFPLETTGYVDNNLLLSTFGDIKTLKYDNVNNLLYVHSFDKFNTIRIVDIPNNQVSSYIGGGVQDYTPAYGKDFKLKDTISLFVSKGFLNFIQDGYLYSVQNANKYQSIIGIQDLKVDLSNGTIQLPGEATSGLPITYTTNKIDFITINGDKAQIKKSGQYITIYANQAGNTEFAAANTVSFYIDIIGDIIITTSRNTSLCKNDSIVLFAPKGFANYLWYPSGAKTDSIIVKTDGTFYVLVNNIKSKNTITTTLNANPNITFNKLPSVIYTNSTPITLTGSPTGGSFSGVGVSGNTFSPFVGKLGKRLITYTYTGASCASTNMVTQEVNVIDTLGSICATYDTLFIKSKITVGVNNYYNTFKIYPNPVSDILMLENSQYLVMSGYKMQLVNTLGQVVYNANITQSIQSFNLSGLVKNAVYFVKLIDDKGTVLETKKIVLE